MCGTAIEKVNVSKFLGIYVNEKLNWKDQIEHTRTKLAKTLGIMHRTRYLFDEPTRKNLYNTLFLPHLNYCSEIWGNTSKTNLQNIVLQQKKALRIICNVKRAEATTPLFKRLNILKFTDLVRFRTAILMQKLFLKQMPHNNLKLFNIKNPKYPQRRPNQFQRIAHRTCLRSFNLFKYKMKQNLIAQYSQILVTFFRDIISSGDFLPPSIFLPLNIS